MGAGLKHPDDIEITSQFNAFPVVTYVDMLIRVFVLTCWAPRERLLEGLAKHNFNILRRVLCPRVSALFSPPRY